MPYIQILSDLRLQELRDYSLFEITPSAPYLALLGDTGSINNAGYFKLLSINAVDSKSFSSFSAIMSLIALVGRAKKKFKRFEDFAVMTNVNRWLGKVVFLDQTRHDLSPGITLLGYTLFSNVLPEQKNRVSSTLKDFSCIDDWSVDKHNQAHTSDLQWLNRQINAISKAEPNRKIIILIHHNNAVKIWVFGHTHFNVDYIEDGKRVVANPKWYFHRQAPGFDPEKCVEI
ncbi:putative calcineurin-like phosphoesterase [Cadophora sp. MPI-SDFR-AT-0126]|nr:putative calcineurin-like phosphoesterase [Leotiomycetes sp. MPI-SDFR-AT-0126]